MNRFLLSASVSAIALGAALAPSALAQDAQSVTVTMIGVSDIEKIDPVDRGGFARLASAIKAERDANENVVVLHAGDSISPSLLAGIDQGEHIIALLNAVGVDVMVPGNHEFDFGPEIFRTRMGELDLTKVAANLREADGSELEGFTDTATLEFGEIQVGVIGLSSADAIQKSSPGDIQFLDLMGTLEEEAAALRDEGADAVVVVAHAGRAEDMEMFSNGAADFIFTGDDHILTTFYDGDVALMEAREQAQFLPVVDVTFTIEGEGEEQEIDVNPSFRIIDTADFEPDADVQAMLDGFNETLDTELNVEIGTTTTALDSRRASVRTQETAIGNLIIDAMREAVEADIGITNGGGIRGDKEYAAGTALTRRDVLTELPFGNKTVSYELTGAQVLSLLENGFSAVEDRAGRFPHVSGLTVEVDTGAEPGSRVTSVMVGDAPLDESATYLVATNDFMARGGDGYVAFTEGTPVLDATTGSLMANDVMAYIRSAGEVSPAPEGRITLN
ncbi:MAG: 5'-nucleotidase C-terminal domain-containing protein [Pseudomonadota bacterium]